MTPTKVKYEITDEDLPILKALYNLEDNRDVYFPNDYHREIESHKYMSQACHKAYEPKKYWLQEVEAKLDFMKVTRFEKVTWYRDSRIEIECDKLLTDTQEKLMFKTMTEIANEMLKTMTITFNVSELKSFQYALSLKDKGIEVFESWLYGNIFQQTKGRLNNSMEIKSTQEGVYQFEFLLGTNEADTQKFVYEWLEEDMIIWLNQDVLNILEPCDA